MNIHKNARLTPLRREEMAPAVIESGLSKARVARIYGVWGKVVARRGERTRWKIPPVSSTAPHGRIGCPQQPIRSSVNA
jgi:hypothetical protein